MRDAYSQSTRALVGIEWMGGLSLAVLCVLSHLAMTGQLGHWFICAYIKNDLVDMSHNRELLLRHVCSSQFPMQPFSALN